MLANGLLHIAVCCVRAGVAGGDRPAGGIKEFAPTVMMGVPKIWDALKKTAEHEIGPCRTVVAGEEHALSWPIACWGLRIPSYSFYIVGLRALLMPDRCGWAAQLLFRAAFLARSSALKQGRGAPLSSLFFSRLHQVCLLVVGPTWFELSAPTTDFRFAARFVLTL